MFDSISKGRWWDKGITLVQGCTRVSKACDHCWALSMANRFPQLGGGKISYDLDRLMKGYSWNPRKPKAHAIWNDLFHEQVSNEDISEAVVWMASAHIHFGHIFLVLTKRIKRAAALWAKLPKGIWIGTTVENQETANDRIPWLVDIKAEKLFLSVEPMLGPIVIGPQLPVIDLVICGCESGASRRETKIEWIRSLRDQCVLAGVPFYLKQMEIDKKIVHAPELDGQQWLELPKEVKQ